MAEVLKAFAKVELYDEGRDYLVTEPGWASPDNRLCDETNKSLYYGRPDIFRVAYEDLYGDGTLWPATVGIEEIKGIIPRPYVDIDQSVGESDFTLSANGSWKEVAGAGQPGQTRIAQENKEGGVLYVARSNFSMVRQSGFALRFYRDGVDKDAEWSSPAVQPGTFIIWGTPAVGDTTIPGFSGGWGIYFGYRGPAALYEWASGQWVWRASGSVKEKNMLDTETKAKDAGDSDDSWYLCVANIGARIVISQDFFETAWVYNRELPDGKERPVLPTDGIGVNEGPLEIRHSGGGFWFAFLPLRPPAITPPLGFFEVGPLDPGYVPTESRGWTTQALQYQKADDEGQHEDCYTATLLDAGDTMMNGTLLAGTQIAARISCDITKIERTDEGVTTWGFPSIHWVQPWVWPKVEAGDARDKTDISDDVKALSITYGAERSVEARITLHNDTPGTYRDLGDYRRLDIQSAEKLDDGTTTGLRHELVALTYAPEFDKKHAQPGVLDIVAADLRIDAQEEICDGTVPIFDNWLVADALQWIFLRCGQPADYQSFREIDSTHAAMEDAPKLPSGMAGNPLFVPKEGAQDGLWKFAKEIAQLDHFTELFYEWRDGETWPHIVTRKRATSATADFTIRVDRPAASYADDFATGVRLLRESSRRKNVVTLLAEDVWGRPIGVEVMDYTHFASIGRKKQVIVQYPVYTDFTRLSELARYVAKLHFQDPMEYEFTMPVRSDIKLDHVLYLVTDNDAGYPFPLNRVSARVISHQLTWYGGQKRSIIHCDKITEGDISGRFEMIDYAPRVRQMLMGLMRTYGNTVRKMSAYTASETAGQVVPPKELFEGVTPTKLTFDGGEYWVAQGTYSPPAQTVNDGLYVVPGAG